MTKSLISLYLSNMIFTCSNPDEGKKVFSYFYAPSDFGYRTLFQWAESTVQQIVSSDVTVQANTQTTQIHSVRKNKNGYKRPELRV